jgi:hypothetical protein
MMASVLQEMPNYLNQPELLWLSSVPAKQRLPEQPIPRSRSRAVHLIALDAPYGHELKMEIPADPSVSGLQKSYVIDCYCTLQTRSSRPSVKQLYEI